MLLNPWVILAAVLSIAGLCTASYSLGVKHEHNAGEAAKLEAVQRAITQAQAMTSEDEAILAQSAQVREKIHTVFRDLRGNVYVEIEKHPEYRNCGLDAIGLRLWNAANSGDPADDSGIGNAGLWGATAGQERKAIGFVAKPPGYNGGLPRLPAPPEGAIGLDTQQQPAAGH